MKENISSLPRAFDQRPTLQVARDLLGKLLIFKGHQGVIIETEAYIGMDDPACHASRGLTKRTAVMFGEAGFSYVYLIYGMYHCLNVVTEDKGFPAAVLIRGVKEVGGNSVILNGPGKVCKTFGINIKHNNMDIINNRWFSIFSHIDISNFKQTPRIGISKGKGYNWRFVADY